MIPLLFAICLLDTAAAAHFAGRWEAGVFGALAWVTTLVTVHKMRKELR